jgi:hypothetical protein
MNLFLTKLHLLNISRALHWVIEAWSVSPPLNNRSVISCGLPMMVGSLRARLLPTFCYQRWQLADHASITQWRAQLITLRLLLSGEPNWSRVDYTVENQTDHATITLWRAQLITLWLLSGEPMASWSCFNYSVESPADHASITQWSAIE